MTKKQERNIIASVGTVLFMGFVILLLWLLQLSVTEQPKKDYIEVEYLEEEIEEPKQEPKPTKNVVASGGNIGKSTPKNAGSDNQSPQDSAEPIKSDEETVEIPHTSVEDSINIAHAQQTRRADSLISSLPFTSQVGNDDIESHENKENEGGNNVGEGEDGNGKWKLANRRLIGSLPKPSKEFKQEGWAEIEISVDADGKVIDATFKRGTISDLATRQLAIKAAKEARFTPAKSGKQVGTITYYFKFN